MRILLIGFFVFVIWSFFSASLYNDKILPLMKEPVSVVTKPETKTNEADSLIKLKALMPVNLLIYFEFNGSKFKPDPQNDVSITEFRNWLDKYPASILSVTGYTDFVGATDYNQALGLKRAEAVRKYLEEKGIPPTRIMTDSKGNDQPLMNNISAEGRAQQRRVEISIKNLNK
jgi:outer membrane protein OmpA-like peptidoglycan-associated protein